MPADRPLIVVGAGVSGLAVAAELAGSVPVIVVDRLPAPGGVLGYEHPIVRSLTAGCENAGVGFLLGTTAVRRNGTRLLTAGPGGVCWTECRHLVFAGGSRPATQAELAIVGERLAGVFPAPVAIHLMEAEVRLGNNVVVLGAGDWSDGAAQQARRQGARLTLPSVQFPGWTPTRLRGDRRVEVLTLVKDGLEHAIECDAVILAAQSRPVRNVDGAIRPHPGITYIQPTAETQWAEDVVAYASAGARQLAAQQLLG